MPRGRPVRSDKNRERFCQELAEHGNVTRASKAISSAHSTVYEWKADDPVFAAAWADAIAQYTKVLEAEADRRAKEGVEEPVFYQGQVVGYVKKYSDILLMFRLKKLDPDGYKERVAQESKVSAEVSVKGTPEQETARINDLLRQLGEIGVYSDGAIRDASRDERTARESAPVA